MYVFVDVDVQRDFCESDGALFVAGSPNDVFRRLTVEAVERGVPIVGSVDSHAYDAWEFASNDNLGPNGEDPRFPDHCVKGTDGWLKVQGTLPARYRFVPNVLEGDAERYAAELRDGRSQGLYFEKEVYSMFANPLAEPILQQLCAQLPRAKLVVYGVATDYCVKAAALGLRERDYDTVVLTDAVAGISQEGVAAALDEMREAGVELATSASLW